MNLPTEKVMVGTIWYDTDHQTHYIRSDNTWVCCNGRLLPIVQHPLLFSLIERKYGGDDAHFRVPDLTSTMLDTSMIDAMDDYERSMRDIK